MNTIRKKLHLKFLISRLPFTSQCFRPTLKLLLYVQKPTIILLFQTTTKQEFTLYKKPNGQTEKTKTFQKEVVSVRENPHQSSLDYCLTPSQSHFRLDYVLGTPTLPGTCHESLRGLTPTIPVTSSSGETVVEDEVRRRRGVLYNLQSSPPYVPSLKRLNGK